MSYCFCFSYMILNTYIFIENFVLLSILCILAWTKAICFIIDVWYFIKNKHLILSFFHKKHRQLKFIISRVSACQCKKQKTKLKSSPSGAEWSDLFRCTVPQLPLGSLTRWSTDKNRWRVLIDHLGWSDYTAVIGQMIWQRQALDWFRWKQMKVWSMWQGTGGHCGVWDDGEKGTARGKEG